MSGQPLEFSDYIDDAMLCPLCGGEYGLHIDGVKVAARVEDGAFTTVEVNGVTGETTYGVDVPGEEGRRHRIVLLGWCELCGDKFAVVFLQHKGATYVETIKMGPAWVEEE